MSVIQLAKKLDTKTKPLQIVFKDCDGSLIMNRKIDMDYYRFDEKFFNTSIQIDARERGVKIISTDAKYCCGFLKNDGIINCVVDYLRKGQKK